MQGELTSPIVVAFGYKARNGKDTAVAEIIKHYNNAGIKRYAFATELKREINLAAGLHGGMFGLFNTLNQHGVKDKNGKQVVLPDYVKFDSNPPMDDPDCPIGKQRTLLQFWGQYRRDHFDKLYWVKAVRNRIKEEKPSVALISDLRYQNEAFWVKQEHKDYGFTVLCERIGYQDLTVNTAHPSEQELSDYAFDFEIRVKDGRLDELKADALTVFEMIMQRVTLGMEGMEQAA